MTSEQPTRTLEFWLARSCDVYSSIDVTERASFIHSFCALVDEELEGAQTACRLIAHRVHSPDETEALYALDVLEGCTKNCQRRFHHEMAKFKFLNELIKLLSPKYLGGQTSDRLKRRVIELFYVWRTQLSQYGKIVEAYSLLKTQGLIKTDPTYLDGIVEHGPTVGDVSEAPRLATFEDEEKARLLATLLASNNPQDLQAANRLIKSLVRAEDNRTMAKCEREGEMESASNNATVLAQMIAQLDVETASDAEVATVSQVHAQLLRQRQLLFKYASENNDTDEAMLATLLTINDDVNSAIDQYRIRLAPHLHKFNLGATSQSASSTSVQPAAVCPSSTSLLQFDSSSSENNNNTTMAAHLSLSDLLGPVGQHLSDASAGDHAQLLARVQSIAVEAQLEDKEVVGSKSTSRVVNALDELSQSLMQQHLPENHVSAQMTREKQTMSMRDMQLSTSSKPLLLQASTTSSMGDCEALLIDSPLDPQPPTVTRAVSVEVPSAASITIEDRPPFLLCDTNNVRCNVFYGGRGEETQDHILLAHVTNSNRRPLNDFVLKLRVKAREEGRLRQGMVTSTSLPAFSPVAAQQSISLPFTVKTEGQSIRVQYTMSFVLEGEEEVATSGGQLIPLLL